MGFLGKLFGGIALAIVLLIGGYYLHKAYKNKDFASMLQATSIEEKPQATPTPAPVRPTPAAYVEPPDPLKNAVGAAATASQVTVTQYNPQPNGIAVTITWQGSNAAQGGDFLNALIDKGAIGDFVETGKDYRNVGGKQVHTFSMRLQRK